MTETWHGKRTGARTLCDGTRGEIQAGDAKRVDNHCEADTLTL
jgi:hypothetical protein